MSEKIEWYIAGLKDAAAIAEETERDIAETIMKKATTMELHHQIIRKDSHGH